MRPSTYTLLAAALLLCQPIEARADCGTLATELFGFGLGAMADYPGNLADGIRREGTAEVVLGVGFESLQGTSHGVRFDRVMAYFDRGEFVGVTAIGSIPRKREAGWREIVDLVSTVTGEAFQLTNAVAEFNCRDGSTLTVEPTRWDRNKTRVKVTLLDPERQMAMREYINEYCSDPARRRPGDACR